jgi:hypothetical protein
MADSSLEYKVQLARELVRERDKKNLPHLTSYPWYPWAREFFESRNRQNLLCAANQISKSSTMIRKCVHWATEKSLWGALWPGKRPNLFWYMYPSQKVLDLEFETKWKEFLPMGSMKTDPVYGWKEKRKQGELEAIIFNSGVVVAFKLYSQKAIDLQSSSVYAMFCDEEMPLHLFDELMFRMSATNGYFHMAFTATLGQDFWRRALEPRNTEKEELPTAWKRTVSLYDSMKYEDGMESIWTEERITAAKARCKSHNEVLKRVYGKFVLAGGRKYESFDATRHMKPPHQIPEDWLVYVGADPGSGGQKGHAAALCYVAVRPDFRSGRVFAGWRGDGVVTDNSAIVQKHLEIKEQKKLKPMGQFYDWASKDFFIVASGMGETFLPADKSHDKGEEILNVLFKNDMLFIYETEELGKLAGELSTLRADENKRHAKDNFADSLRYAVTLIPWDFSGIGGEIKIKKQELEEKLSPMQQQIRDRREQMFDEKEDPWPTPDEEFEEWNEAAGA